MQRGPRLVVEWGGGFVALFLPICFNPYAVRPFEPAKVTLFRWTVGLMLVALVLSRLLDRDHGNSAKKISVPLRMGRDPLALPIFFYAGTILLSTVFSINRRLSFWGSEDQHGTFTYLALFLFYFLLRDSLRSNRHVSRLISAILLGSVPVTLYGLAQFIGVDPLSWQTDSVSPTLSTMGRSNFFGAYVATVFPFVLFRMWRAPSYWRSAALALLLLVGAFTSQARGAWLGLVGGTLIFAGSLAHWRRSRRYLWGTLTVLIVGLSFFVIMNRLDPRSFVQQGANRSSSGLSFAEVRAGTVQSRFGIWRTTLDLIPPRWLHGYGPETFAQVFHAHTEETDPDIIVDHPHNLVLDLLMSSGVLGLAAFLSILWTFYAHSWKALKETTDSEDVTLYAAVMGSVTAFLIQAQFNPDVTVLWVLFWMALAMGSASWESKDRA